MTATPTTTNPADLARLTASAQQAQALAAEASAKASAAQAAASAAAERIHIAQDAASCRWAEATIAAAPDEERRLIAATDAARVNFERGIAEGQPDFPSRYLEWSGAAGQLFHHRGFVQNLHGHLAHRRPQQHAAPDAGRSGGHDSRVTVPDFIDAVSRTVAHVAASRNGDYQDAMQAQLQAAMRGES